MEVVALALFAAYLVVGFGLRSWLQWRRTGDIGYRGIAGPPGSVEWWAGVSFVVAMVAGGAGPVLGLLGLDAVSSLEAEWLQVLGVVLAVVGIVGTFLAQLDMGASWRIGVDEAESTDLVTTGAFAMVRNPIFTAMATTGAGLALMVPNVVSILGLGLLLAALQLQVRIVEEPCLREVHGDEYARYAASTGRFLPSWRRGEQVASAGRAGDGRSRGEQ